MNIIKANDENQIPFQENGPHSNIFSINNHYEEDSNDKSQSFLDKIEELDQP